DGTVSSSQTAGDTMTVSFTGTAVEWIGPKANDQGTATVSIDGGPPETVDGYAASTAVQQVLFSATGLAAGPHTMTIVVLGQKDAASSADTVAIDAVNVPDATQQAGFYPTVPQSGTLTLQGRDARLLVANDAFGGQQLVYSTSELMTQAVIA